MSLNYLGFLWHPTLAFCLIYIVARPIHFLVSNAWKSILSDSSSLLEKKLFEDLVSPDGNYMISLIQLISAFMVAAFLVVWASELSILVFWLTIGWFNLKKFRSFLRRQKIMAEPRWRTE
jgi:hypothetical protein